MSKLNKIFAIIIIFVLLMCLAGFKGIYVNEANQVTYNFKLNDFPNYNEYVQFTSHYNNPQIKVLYNMNDEPEYLLVYAEDQGYAVFNRISGQLLEMSENDDNPYEDISKGYYLAPFSYASGNLNNLIDVNTGFSYSTDEKRIFKKLQTNLTRKNVLQKSLRLNEAVASGEDFEFDNTEYCLSALDASSYTNVAYADTIMKWYEGNGDFLINYNGICSQVALTLLYRYADLVYGGIIPQLPPQSWVDACAGNSIVDGEQTVDFSLENTTNANYTMTNFTRYLVKLSGITTPGTSNNEMLQAINTYNAEISNIGCLNITALTHTQNNTHNLKQFVLTGINNNRPTAISIFSSKGNEIGRHKVLAYGIYYDLETTLYRVHTGWNWKSSYYISEDYVNLSENFTAVQLNVMTNANHNLSYSADSHSCNNSNCYANSVSHRYHSYDEGHICICGKIVDEHNWTCAYSNLDHYVGVHICEACGAYEEHELQNYSNAFHKCSICNCLAYHDWRQINNNHICAGLCGASGSCYSEDWNCVDSSGNTLLTYHTGECEICHENINLNHSGCISLGSIGHSINCDVCELNISQTPHIYIYESINSSEHEKKCLLCGYIQTTANHQFEACLGFFLRCKICGYMKLRTV